MTTYLPIPMPNTTTAEENWAEKALDAWVSAYGGVDVTGDEDRDDYATWVGDVEIDGVTWELSCWGQSIFAERVER